MDKPETVFISGNARVLRNVNRAVILNVIRERQPISRSRIAKITGMNKSTVSNIVSELLEQGLILEENYHDPKIGRNPINLRLQLGRHFVGAINFDVPYSHVAIADIDGSVLIKSKIPSINRAPEELSRDCMQELLSQGKRKGISNLKGIGISIAGVSNPDTLTVHYAPRLGWEMVNIGSIFTDVCKTDCFVTINNDARAAALAELWFGDRDRNLNNFVYVYVGDGVGTGIVVEKKLVQGAHFAAGEFGHTTVIEHGELCSCGNYGCWEAYASNHATIRRYLVSKRKDPNLATDLTFEELLSEASGGDSDAREALIQTGHYLGLGIANILKAIDPEVIILGGEITQVFDLIFPEIQKTVQRRSFFGLEKSLRILPSSIQEKPLQLIGAATLAISELFSDYKIVR